MLTYVGGLEIRGEADVTLKQGASEGVTIGAPVQQMPRIRTGVRNRTLIVTPEAHRHW